jgi:ferrochelatase
MKEKTGVVLLNMGGPEKPEDVAPFLYNLFSDRDIIRLGPGFLQKPIAWYISRKRAPKSRKIYAEIGGGSPLIRITGEQAEALQQALADSGDFVVVTAMRYWQPSSSRALQILAEQNIGRIVALPLYPHFSCATSGSSLADLKRAAAKGNFDISEIHGWPDNPLYIECLAENILKGLAAFPAPSEDIEILYSAHSLPVSFINEGDPYLDQLKITIAKIEEITGVAGRLCFQSKSGPVEWLAPSTPDMLEQLAREGCGNILMVPISFVSDHVETLYEINMLYRDMAKEKGMCCRPCESLNTHPLFIQALKKLVLEHMTSGIDS